MLRSFAVFSLLCLTASAAPGTVQVKSFLCGTQASITTSGVPVLFNGKKYVLTSSWGVLEEDSGICHEVVELREKRVSTATLAVLNWSLGYALLETPDLSPTINLEDLTSALPTSAEVEVQGFAGTKRGRIIASKSTRHHLTGLPFSFEIISDRITNTFIGAPVYGKNLDGIVAGQWIEIVAGSRARIHEWKTGGDELPRHLIIIPISLIRESLKDGLPPRSTFQASASKLKDRKELLTGNYQWLLDCPPDAGEPPPDGIGPIGGADGVGVGGGMKGAVTCTAQVSPQNQIALAQPSFLSEKLSADLKNGLADQKFLSLPFLVQRDAGNHIARVPFFSTPHFFNELAKNKQWIFLPEKPAVHTGPTPYEEMMRETAKVKAILLETYPIIAPREDERGDYRRMYTHLVVLESMNWRVMKWNDYASLASTVSPDDFAKGVEYQGQPLRTVLRAIYEKMLTLSHSLEGHL